MGEAVVMKKNWIKVIKCWLTNSVHGHFFFHSYFFLLTYIMERKKNKWNTFKTSTVYKLLGKTMSGRSEEAKESEYNGPRSSMFCRVFAELTRGSVFQMCILGLPGFILQTTLQTTIVGIFLFVDELSKWLWVSWGRWYICFLKQKPNSNLCQQKHQVYWTLKLEILRGQTASGRCGEFNQLHQDTDIFYFSTLLTILILLSIASQFMITEKKWARSLLTPSEVPGKTLIGWVACLNLCIWGRWGALMDQAWSRVSAIKPYELSRLTWEWEEGRTSMQTSISTTGVTFGTTASGQESH